MNNEQFEHIKLFLNKCKIPVNTFGELDGMLIPREIFLALTKLKVEKVESSLYVRELLVDLNLH